MFKLGYAKNHVSSTPGKLNNDFICFYNAKQVTRKSVGFAYFLALLLLGGQHFLSFFRNVPHLLVPLQAISRASYQIFAFLFVWLLFLFGWSVFFLVWCGELLSFRDFGKALLFCMKVSAGDFDTDEVFADTQFEGYADVPIMGFRLFVVFRQQQQEIRQKELQQQPVPVRVRVRVA